MPALPGVVRQQRRTGDQILQRRGVGRRSLGALAGDQVELGQLLALVSRGDQGRAAVELIDDVEDRLLPLLGRDVRREQPPDSKVRLVAQRLRDQRIGGFLNAIVDELVGAFQVLDQLQTNGVPEIRTDVLGRFPEDQGKRPDRGDVPEAGELLQRPLRIERQAVQPAHHQIDDVVPVPLRVHAIEVPGPLRALMIEREPSFFGERVKKLNEEERIAGRLLVHQLRERGGARRLAAKRIRNELPHVFTGERRKRDLLHVRSRVPDRFELAHQRMGRSDFVVPVGADQHQVLHVRLGQQILEQIERRRVEPLQVVEEERQRMFRPGEHADEPPEHQLETPSRVLRRELGNRRLVSDDELQLRDEVDHEPSVRAQRLRRRASRQPLSSASLLPRRGRTRLWKACASVA